MFCMKCGTKLPEDAVFCMKCGLKTVAPASVATNAPPAITPPPAPQPQYTPPPAITPPVAPQPQYTPPPVVTAPPPQIKNIEEYLSYDTTNLIKDCGIETKWGGVYELSPVGIGGYAHFFDSGFVFRSRKLNLEQGYISFYYSDIAEVKSTVRPPQVVVTLQDGSEHPFTVEKSKKVENFLTTMSRNGENHPFTPSTFVYVDEKLGEKPSNIWVWLCCLVPVLTAIISYFISQEDMSDIEALSAASNIMRIAYFLNCGLCYFDGIQLKKRGLETADQAKWAFLVPVYLFKRAKILGENNLYAVLWCLTFGISLFF